MYRRRGPNPFSIILRMVVLGIVIGAGYLIYDNWRNPTTAPDTTEPLAVETTIAEEPVVTNTPAAAPLDSTEASVPTTLFVPSAGILAPVIQVYLDGTSWDISNLGMNVGHLQGTAWIDSPGNIVLSAHVEMSDGRQGVFAPIRELVAGDLVILTHGTDERRYSVTETLSVEPTDLSVLYPSTTERLTLITCDAYDFFQDNYQERYVVIADRIQ